MRFLPLILLGAIAFLYVSRPAYGLSSKEVQHNLEEESRIISELQSEVDNEETANSNAVTSPAMEMADAALLEIGAISATEVEKGGKGGSSRGGASRGGASRGGAKASGKKSGASKNKAKASSKSKSKKSGRKAAKKGGKKGGKKNGRNASKKARKSGRKAGRKSRKSGRKARKARRKPKRIASKTKRTLSQHRQRARKAKLNAFKAAKNMKKWAKAKGKKLSAAAKKARLAAKKAMLKALGKLKLQYKRRRLRQMQAKADALVAAQRKDNEKLKKAMHIPQWKPFVPKGYKPPRRQQARRRSSPKKVDINKLKKQIKKQLKKKLQKLNKKKTARREARKQKQWAKKQAKKADKAKKKAAKRKALRTAQKLKSLFNKSKERNALQKSAEEVGKVFVPKAAVAAKKKKPARKMRTILPAAKPRLAKAAPQKPIKKCKKKSVIQLLKAKLAENKKKAMHLHHQLVKFQKYGTRKMKWNIDEDGTGSGLHVPPNVPKKDKQALKDYEKMMKNVETLHLLGANKWSIAEADIKKGHVLTNLADAQRERLRDFDQEQQAEMLTPEGWASGEIEPDVYNEFEPIH